MSGSPLFEARYYSNCVGCGEKIEPGEMAGFNEGDSKVSCEECWVDTWVPWEQYREYA